MLNKRQTGLLCWIILGFYSPGFSQQASKPVIHVNTEFPTRDKPQSKLWYMHNTWWTILPTKSGPSIWKRIGTKSWELQANITRQLNGLPGRVDVDVWGQTVHAVGVESQRLSVFELDGKNPSELSLKHVAHLSIPDQTAAIETATLVRDKSGQMWVAADVGSKVLMWHSSDAGDWSQPVTIAEGIDADDISSITATSTEVHIVWSNQLQGAYHIRSHSIADPYTEWSELKTIISGTNAADDHINIKTGKNQSQWMVTKNSTDTYNIPLLDLWRKNARDEKWQQHSFAPLTPNVHPSRPVVILTEHPDVVFVGYTIYSLPDKSTGIVQFAQVNVKDFELNTPRTLIYSTRNMINDVSTAKRFYPKEAREWIVLASDQAGRVYEADLKAQFMSDK